MAVHIIETGIEGLRVELPPRFGDDAGAVWHMLPGGTDNPDAPGGKILDVYAFHAAGKGTFRGGHYHMKLEELFFPIAGTALWILSDFREGSPTKGRTVGLILGDEAPTLTTPEAQSAIRGPVPMYLQSDGTLPRLRVPAGVYHAIFPLSERIMTVALGSTPYDKEDYAYPELKEVPGAEDLLAKFGITNG